MATATNFDAWLDDVDGDYEEVMALYDSVQNVSDMGLYQCVEGGRGDAWVVSSNHHPEALFLASAVARDTFLKLIREGANKSPNIKMRLCKYLNLIN